MSSFSHRRGIKGDQYFLMASFNHGKGSMSLMYRLEVLVTAASMPGVLPGAVIGHQSRVGVVRRLRGSSVNHCSRAARRPVGNTAPVSSFIRRIGWRETEFAQQYAQGDVHLHGGERRADATVDAAAKRNPGLRLRGTAEEPVRVERHRI